MGDWFSFDRKRIGFFVSLKFVELLSLIKSMIT